MNQHEVIETLKMIQEEKLDIRTITMGISLRDCADGSVKKSCGRIRDKIGRLAGRLAAVGDEIEESYGVPIINKRIAVTPIALVAAEIEDVVVFAIPEGVDRRTIRHFRLELPAEAYGGSGVYRFEIPRQSIQGF